MLFGQKPTIPQPNTQESDGLHVILRLSGKNLIKLLSIIITLLFSSGLLVHSTSKDLSADTVNTVELIVQEKE